ncbi:hypothetical protein ACD661_05750 [Legionella lytica]|uniref:Dot/Icm T4SS effector n=1 Tax=Legionella lytica TaxID=96232 RepID=A0ABW8D5T1_9GAMM
MPNDLITIDINEDQFFIAIAKTEVHSFILFGVYNQFTVKKLLSRVGKAFYHNQLDDSCLEESTRLLQLCTVGVPARLMDERVVRRSCASKGINYQAYDIRYEQYLEYLEMLGKLSTEDNFFSCYQPYHKSDEQIKLKLDVVTPTQGSDARVDKIKDSVTNLNLGNTCRHSAIELVEAVQMQPISASVSTNFFQNLPYQTELMYGHPSITIPFYVLPVPPSAYIGLGDEKEQILRDLYAGMERLPLIAPHEQITMDKFSRLKELYNDIAGPQKDLSLDQLLQNIQEWKSKNRVVLDSLREKFWVLDSFFKRTPATMLLVNNLESRLEKLIGSSLSMRC